MGVRVGVAIDLSVMGVRVGVANHQSIGIDETNTFQVLDQSIGIDDTNTSFGSIDRY